MYRIGYTIQPFGWGSFRRSSSYKYPPRSMLKIISSSALLKWFTNGQRFISFPMTLIEIICFWTNFIILPSILWQGTPFADICELTDVPEGLIVRTIVRLDETCREFRNAAAIMGNSALHKKMEAASNAIKRDIVFAASLYITGIWSWFMTWSCSLLYFPCKIMAI